ncbi:MAG: matrixin family metalloprotease [Candidatus Aenigmatarchaeota archaeon]|nr:matrixin family metalloprotease [Candidatus Aenigmarchaeota archaeon]
MNIIGFLFSLLLFVSLITISYKLGQVIIELNVPVLQSANTTKLTLPEEPMSNFTLRWNHFPLTVYMQTDFIKQKPEYATNFREALNIWQTATKNLVEFSMVTSPEADLTVEWVPDLKEKALDTLGNTDIKFINVSGFGLIQKAKIQLLTKTNNKQLSETDMINLALHEIGHALGLSHSNDENDIMYPTLTIPTKEIKSISQKEIQKLQEIYAIKPKPDLRIVEVNVSKATVKRFVTTFYLANISLMVENTGLLDATSPHLLINADNVKVKQEILPDIPLGNRLNVIFGNLHIENDFNVVEIIIDPENVIEELNEENNIAKLYVS